MIENALLQDGEYFSKQKQIRAKRPSEYWLLFIKRYVLSYKKSGFRLWYLLFLIPVIILIALLISNANSDIIVPFIFASVFLSVIIGAISVAFTKNAFVPLDAFQDLAKFIISIKGDIYKNLINLSINSSVIEENINLLDPKKIGLRRLKGVKYKPYEIERFRANFTLKDGSVCLVSLHQIALRVTTTKRRSSGKTKTKTKHKHKFFYQLTLKLKESDYIVMHTKELQFLSKENTPFDISIKADGEFHWIKIKSKIKLFKIASKLNEASKHKDSIFTNMMQYLLKNKVMVNRTSSKLIQ